jgi:hypothetical protein
MTLDEAREYCRRMRKHWPQYAHLWGEERAQKIAALSADSNCPH